MLVWLSLDDSSCLVSSRAQAPRGFESYYQPHRVDRSSAAERLAVNQVVGSSNLLGQPNHGLVAQLGRAAR